jgi:hypothetical protein
MGPKITRSMYVNALILFQYLVRETPHSYTILSGDVANLLQGTLYILLSSMQTER